MQPVPAIPDYSTQITVVVVGMVLTFLSTMASIGVGWLRDSRERRWKTEDKLYQQEIAAKTDVLVKKVEETKKQGEVIHDLVNSNMTAAKQDQLIALQGQQVLMQRVLLAAGTTPTKEEEATLFSLEVKIKDLGEEVRLRNLQQETAKLKAETDRAEVKAAAPPTL